MKRKNRSYTEKEKVEFLIEFYTSGLTKKKWAEQKEISYSTVNSWSHHKGLNKLVKKSGLPVGTVLGGGGGTYTETKSESKKKPPVVKDIDNDIDTPQPSKIKLLNAENFYLRTLLEVNGIKPVLAIA